MKRIIYSLLLGLASYGAVAVAPVISSSNSTMPLPQTNNGAGTLRVVSGPAISSSNSTMPVPQKLTLSFEFDSDDTIDMTCQDVFGAVTLKKIGKYSLNKSVFDEVATSERQDICNLTTSAFVFMPPASWQPTDPVTVDIWLEDEDDPDANEELCNSTYELQAGVPIADRGCKKILLKVEPLYNGLR